MKKSNFTKRILKAEAYWINPDGLFMAVDSKHILKVIDNPAAFGLTLEAVQACYNREGELLGVEKKAREKIILHLISRGYIRIRKNYRPDRWTVNAPDLSAKTGEYLKKWSSEMIESGVGENSDLNIDLPGGNVHCTMGELLREIPLSERTFIFRANKSNFDSVMKGLTIHCRM